MNEDGSLNLNVARLMAQMAEQAGPWLDPMRRIEAGLPKQPVASGAPLEIARIPSDAEWMHERITQQICDYESKLSPEDEVGAYLVNAPGQGVFHVENVGYWGPDMLIFHGLNSHGKPVQLMQHISQMNVFLTALPKLHEPARRIGFDLVRKNDLAE